MIYTFIISWLSCQNLVTSIFAEKHFLIALKTVYRCQHCVKICTPKPIKTGLKSCSKSRIPPIHVYDILRSKKFKKFKSPFVTIHPENMTMILHTQKDLFQSKQYPLCTKSIFAHQDWKQLHNKSIFINCFKNTWGKTSYLGKCFRIKTL